MNDEYDVMKDNSSEVGKHHQTDKDIRRESDSISRGRDTSHVGQGYTNTDGSHGFIYNPSTHPELRNRSYRGALIAVVVVLATLIVGSCCFIGAYVATRSLYGRDGNAPAEGGKSELHEAETSDGLVISADTSPDDKGVKNPFVSGDAGNGQESGDNKLNHTDNGSIPPVASIIKLPPKRTDKNGDGRPEIETDVSGEVLTSAGTSTMSVATVVSRVAASVVEIITETIVQSDFVGQYISGGAGSGVIISKEGFIVTNHHVIEGANTITVRLNSGKEFVATLVGTDKQTDIAVLWIQADETDLTVATLGASFDLVVGEDILAIGNPLGSLGGTVTEGMVSATAREISIGGVDMTLLQVSAPINPGNSGGGLFNLAGELVGIVNAKMSSEEIEGLGFAIPVDTAYSVIRELIEYGYVRNRPDLGFSIMNVTSVQTAMRYFNSFYTGVYVSDRSHDTVQYGDLILSADGKEIHTAEELKQILTEKSIGDTMELLVYRNRKKIAVTVTVSESIPDVLKTFS